MNEVERLVTGVWRRALRVAQVGIDEKFIELGGNSLIALSVVRDLQRETGLMLPAVTLFECPTVRTLARHLAGLQANAATSMRLPDAPLAAPSAERDIAIIAITGRFPGAASVEEFWRNLAAGTESISDFSKQELPEFDANFFGFSPREAELTDPEQRVFLECAWEAMERAGYDAEQFAGRVGVFATSAAYRLDRRGASVAVQTHCSTSLVAAHLACQSLLAGECDLALAGGVSVRAPQNIRDEFQLGGEQSPAGHTRSLDRAARGTVFGDGCGVAVLKRLREALADGDAICAVIKGSAINHDGALRAGLAASSVEGQARAVRQALTNAGIDPASIGYVEAHGSATELGDPIEVRALTKAFRESTTKRQFCAVGSVKANVGHLGKAAGVAGLIKATLALQNRLIPRAVNFEEPNPEVDVAGSPFYVPRATEELVGVDGLPRRASVNALDMGGTTAHVVLEEAPALPPSSAGRPVQLLPLSAKTSTALAIAESRLVAYLREHPDVPLADIAFTLQVGRRRFAHRRAVVCRDHAEALASLENGCSRAPQQNARTAAVAFIYPGQGEHYAGMAATLYAREPTFRAAVDRCVAVVRTAGGVDLSPVLCSPHGRAGADLRTLLAGGAATLPATQSQTATFIVEHAMTELLATWGIAPQAVLGSSLGEYAAACAAGVWTLEDALRIVTWRAAAIAELPGGVMLAVPLDAATITPWLPPEVTVAIVAGPQLTVVAGPASAVEDVEDSLAGRSVVSRRLTMTHALHTAMMAPMRAALEAFLAGMPMRAPQTPYVSGLTGTWATDGVATPAYWGRHLCEPVQLAAGIDTLRQEPERVWLEVGPGQSLTTLLKQHAGADPRTVPAVATMPSLLDCRTDEEVLADAVGQLWLSGAAIDWAGYHAGERCRRVLLPTYPFERQGYWRHAPRHALSQATADANQ